jgi:hypothetical protein
MADRTMYIGDTYPDALFQVSDETGVLDLSTASSIEVLFIGKAYEFSGAGYAIQPPEDDPVSDLELNCGYTFADDDTSEADVYQPFVVVTWTSGKIETYPTTDILTVKELPQT